MNCNNCNNITDEKRILLKDLINIKTNKELYPDSEYIYCEKCWEKRDIELKCEICKYDYIGYKCEKDRGLLVDIDDDYEILSNVDYIGVCRDCRCSGTECIYCPEKSVYDKLYDIYISLIESSGAKINNYIKEYMINMINKPDNDKIILYNNRYYKRCDTGIIYY
jgi:hypothetical protein